jgi:hypothetical protein
MIWDATDSDFQAFLDAFTENTTLELLILEAAIASGVEGLRAAFDVTEFTRSEALEGVVTAKVKAEVAYSANAPAWYTGA